MVASPARHHSLDCAMKVLVGSLAVAVIASTAAATLPPGEQYTSPIGLPLVKTTMAEVQARLGSAVTASEGHDQDVACYFWPKSRTLIKFSIGHEGLDGTFTLQSIDPATLRRKCPEIAADRVTDIAPAVGALHLGMTRTEFAAALGLPEGATGVTFSREDPARRSDGSLDPQNEIFTTIEISAYFDKDRLTQLRVSKSAST
jgi:hypothetical protein